MTREKGLKLGKIAEHNLETAINESLAMAKGQRREELARSAGADRCVVLERDDLLKEGGVARCEPCEAESRQAVGFADGAETEGAVVAVASGRETRGRVVLEFAVNLVGENVDAAAGGEFEHGVEDGPWHQEAGRIVRRVDVYGSSAWADQGFEGIQIVSPAGRGLATPFTDRRTGARGNGEHRSREHRCGGQ